MDGNRGMLFCSPVPVYNLWEKLWNICVKMGGGMDGCGISGKIMRFGRDIHTFLPFGDSRKSNGNMGSPHIHMPYCYYCESNVISFFLLCTRLCLCINLVKEL